MPNLDQKASQRYWDTNLDPQNLQCKSLERDLELEWKFYSSDEQRFATRHMPPLEGKACLELGGGMGTHALWLASKGAVVTVVDFSPQRLIALMKVARKHDLHNNIRVAVCMIEALPFHADQFDLVYTKSVLIHSVLPNALIEARRVLNIGGRAIFIEPLNRNPFAILYRRFFAPAEWQSITRYLDSESISEIKEVFPDIEIRAFYFFGFAAFIWQFKWPNLMLFRCGQTLTRLVDRPLFTLLPSLQNFAWFKVFVGQKDG
jgi:SAM-dependent methyltransferase